MSITAPEWTTPPGVLGQLTANAPVAINVHASGLVKYMLRGGDLPAGLSLTDYGVVTGTPCQPGEFDFIICACNGMSRTSRNFSLVVQ